MEGDLDTWVSMNDKNRLSVWCAENKKTVFINDMQHDYVKYISNLDSLPSSSIKVIVGS